MLETARDALPSVAREYAESFVTIAREPGERRMMLSRIRRKAARMLWPAAPAQTKGPTTSTSICGKIRHSSAIGSRATRQRSARAHAPCGAGTTAAGLAGDAVGRADAPEAYQVGGEWKAIVRSLPADDQGARRRRPGRVDHLLRNSYGASATFRRADKLQFRTEQARAPEQFQLYVSRWMDLFGEDSLPEGRAADQQPDGLVIGGDFYTADALRHNFYAHRMADLADDFTNPIVCEVGGGFGGFARHLLSRPGSNFRYLDYDLPVMCIASAYYLMTALPDKRLRLFGEVDDLAEPLHDADLAILPNFALPRLGDQSVDICFNTCSFAEMETATCRSTRTSSSVCAVTSSCTRTTAGPATASMPTTSRWAAFNIGTSRPSSPASAVQAGVQGPRSLSQRHVWRVLRVAVCAPPAGRGQRPGPMNLLRKLTSAPATAHRAERGRSAGGARHVETSARTGCWNKRRRMSAPPSRLGHLGDGAICRGRAKRCQ